MVDGGRLKHQLSEATADWVLKAMGRRRQVYLSLVGP